MVVMAKPSVKRSQVVMNPMFFIPEGVDELIYDDSERNFSVELVSDSDALSDEHLLVDESETDGDDEIPTPLILGVISQTLRTTESGAQVVDVVIEVEDIPGLSNYELRVTKK